MESTSGCPMVEPSSVGGLVWAGRGDGATQLLAVHPTVLTDSTAGGRAAVRDKGGTEWGNGGGVSGKERRRLVLWVPEVGHVVM